MTEPSGGTATSLFRIPAPTPGTLSTMPGPQGGDRIDDEMRALRLAGLDVLVCLQTDAERAGLGLSAEPTAAAAAGLEFHAYPIADFGVPDHDEIQPLLDLLTGRLRDGRHVAVHCRGGVGRSSLVAAALLVGLGAPVDHAWRIVAKARGVRVPETEAQGQWLRDHPVARGL